MLWNYIISTIFIFGDIFLKVMGASKLTLYGGPNPIIVSGSDCPYGAIIDNSVDISCACLTGLWAFYDDTCSGPTLITGSDDEKCVQINLKVKKVHLLSSPSGNSDTASVFANGMKIITTRLESDGPAKTASINATGEFTVLATGSKSWGLTQKKSCLGASVQNLKAQYCSYTSTAADDGKLDVNCNANATTTIQPSKCTPFIQTSFECPVPVHKIKPRGRVFLGTVIGMGSNNSLNASILSDSDENKNLTVNITHPEINSQLWNYLTAKSQEILNLTNPVKQIPPTPIFKFLEIAKQILQKACPDHYVKDGHFDMTLSTFTNLQTKHYKYQDSFSDYAAGQRIEDSLNLCLQNITNYPFIDPKKIQKTKLINCSTEVEMGTYEMFGTTVELNISSESASREREPIIETVWKIFTHAHAACYKYFEESFNDHHRFTSVLMPVFINEINDVWKSINNVTKDTYSGLLGNALKLMDGVAYCAEFSKLESTYPWELPRPEKDLSNKRRKRSLSSDMTCLKQSFDNKCSE